MISSRFLASKPPSPDDLFPRGRIAVIGAGISGAAAAWLLSDRHDVVLYEQDQRIGGHANTLDVSMDGREQPVDTGFIVFNDHNYPHFTALLDHLQVASQPSDMSFAVSLDNGRMEYSGQGLSGLFAQRRNLLRPGHWRMLMDIVQFYRQIIAFSQSHDLSHMTLHDLLVRFGCSAGLTRGHILPMAAAIWSTPIEQVLDFPAASFVRFFENHGLFKLRNRPRWRTIAGGSRVYVAALNAAFKGETRKGARVLNIARNEDGVWVKAEGCAPERYDSAVLACHADQALAVIDRPSAMEQRLLSAFQYVPNRAVLHRDRTWMPRTRRCWASWNYLSRKGDGDGEKLLLTYWMNRLQNLDQAHDLFVTLNPHQEPRDILAEIAYDHPQYSREALMAQQQLHQLQGMGGLWFCGAHFGHGFHEDGLASALAVARDFGIDAPWVKADAVAPDHGAMVPYHEAV
ncbi:MULTISPECIES: FAD-dependent oxidoreductase [unclassified Iodidimonas]|jgi:predicted NAD/FAD-binding protein|uniref:NAD(P)/FAD-dependent oxidoreductase n=1 Tax=unclassified Iodidimonas TaxID=2626145 RepID=UPI00248233DB|nr:MULTISPECIES: FAD-dependent oxidoreductase [unclassified Iodidimonas]